jgi:hypothetical protein
LPITSGVYDERVRRSRGNLWSLGQTISSSGPVRFAGMTGSSIAGPDAAPWITDFLNAAYFRRPLEGRDVDDLRAAFTVLTTFWYRKTGGRRLHVTDLPAFHRAFGSRRFNSERSPLGTLSRDQLVEGANRLLGFDFAGAYGDDARRAWGIAFPTVKERDAYDPDRRMAVARLGPLTPETAHPEQQVWHAFAPVQMPSLEGVIGVLSRPESWPDFASETGRFTPLRAGGLSGQTFEIEVAAGTGVGWPVFTRGYVTVTKLVSREQPDALAAWFAELDDGLRDHGEPPARALPEDATPALGFDLTTHEGHFMGQGHNRIMLYRLEGSAWVRTAGTWDPMPWHLDRAYRLAGQETQRAFWGEGDIDRLSMLHQLARRVAASGAG